MTPTGDHRFLEGRCTPGTDSKAMTGKVGLSGSDEASKALPMLNGVHGYPTAILANRSGRVFSIHAGFAGPAMGRHYEEHVKEFRDEVEQLLAAQAAG
jgi:hypothetical protein